MPIENAPLIDHWYYDPLRLVNYHQLVDPGDRCHFICKPILCEAAYSHARDHWKHNFYAFAKHDVHLNCPGDNTCVHPKDENGHLKRQGVRVDPGTRRARAYLETDVIRYYTRAECRGCKHSADQDKKKHQEKKGAGDGSGKDGGNKDGGGAAGAAGTKPKGKGASNQGERTKFYDPARNSFVDTSGPTVRSLTWQEVQGDEDLRAEFLTLTEKDPGEDDDDEDETKGEGSSKQSSLTHFAAPAA